MNDSEANDTKLMTSKANDNLFFFRQWIFQNSDYLKNGIHHIQNEERKNKRNGIFFTSKNIYKQKSYINEKFKESSQHKTVNKAGEFFFGALKQEIKQDKGSGKKEREKKRKCRAEISFRQKEC